MFVNDRATTSTGADRRYVSHGLRDGLTYEYRLRVEFDKDGKPVVENRSVLVRAGDSIDLQFGSSEQLADQRDATTELTLHVPKQAKVTLAGAPTAQTGEVRTYATSTLAPGTKWNDYVVHVELDRSGKKLVEEKTLNLVGGEKYQLTFDFKDEPQSLASLH